MPIGYSRYISRIYSFGDLFVLNFSFFIISYYLDRSHLNNINNLFLSQFLYASILWLIALMIFHTDEISRVMKFETVLYKLFKTSIFHFLCLVSLSYFLPDHINPFDFFYYKYLLFIFILFLWRSVALLTIRLSRKGDLISEESSLLEAGHRY